MTTTAPNPTVQEAQARLERVCQLLRLAQTPIARALMSGQVIKAEAELAAALADQGGEP